MVLGGELDLASSLESALRLFVGSFNLFVFILGAFVAPVETNGRFQHQEYVVSRSFDLADRLRDAVGFGEGIVNRVSQLLHEALQRLIHKNSLIKADAPSKPGVPPATPSTDCSGGTPHSQANTSNLSARKAPDVIAAVSTEPLLLRL